MDINAHLADFRRRYEHTFIWVSSPSMEETLFHVDRVIPDNEVTAVLELSSRSYGKIRINLGTKHTLKFKYPPVGVFQNGPDAYVFRRLPERQYKHGICAGNSRLGPVWHRLVGAEAEMEIEDVEAAYKHQQYSYKEAVEMLNSGKYRSVALKGNMALSLSPTAEKQFLLMFWDHAIALTDFSGKAIITLDKLYKGLIDGLGIQ